MQNPQQIKEKLVKNTKSDFPFGLLLFYFPVIVMTDVLCKLNTISLFLGLLYLNERALEALLFVPLVTVIFGSEYLFLNLFPSYVVEKHIIFLLLIPIFLITEIFIGMHCREIGIALGFIVS